MPVSAAAIPPWIAQPADPAGHFAQGYQIGVHTGAQQAAQAFQQQQMALQERKMLMAQQQQEYEDQMNAQLLNMKAAETARKFQANQAFRARVASGEEPARVLMELAPDMGESPTAILHQQAVRDQARAMMGYRQANMQRLMTAGEDRQRIAQGNLAVRTEQAQESKAAKAMSQAVAQQRERRLAQTAIQRDQELKALRDTLAQAETELRDARMTPKGWFQTQSTYDERIKALEKSRSDAASAVDSRLKELRQEYSLDEPATVRASESGGDAGDNTMPDQPTSTGEEAPQAAAPSFVAGKTYVDANGNRAVYQEDGTWQEVK